MDVLGGGFVVDILSLFSKNRTSENFSRDEIVLLFQQFSFPFASGGVPSLGKCVDVA